MQYIIVKMGPNVVAYYGPYDWDGAVQRAKWMRSGPADYEFSVVVQELFPPLKPGG